MNVFYYFFIFKCLVNVYETEFVFHSLCIKPIKTKETADWSKPDFENLSC